jgi:hypothetical protein
MADNEELELASPAGVPEIDETFRIELADGTWSPKDNCRYK